MTHHPAAALMAADYPHLQHTNDRGEVSVVQMPGFNTAGMSEEQVAATLGPLALGIAEAQLETLQARHGYVVHHEDEPCGAQADDDEPATHQGLVIHCNRCRADVFELRMANPDFVKISVETEIARMQAHLEVCAG